MPLDLDALTAIDVHVHVESDGHGHKSLDDELLDASAAYFHSGQDRTPTVERLAAEWNLPVDTVRQMLRTRNLKPHPHSAEADDGILGDQLYDRTEVDPLAPYSSVGGPTDFREASSYEPDLLQ